MQREDARNPGQRARGDRVDRAAGHQLLGGLEDQPHADGQFGHRRQRQRGAQQDRGVRIVAAGVGDVRHHRCVRRPGPLGHRQRVHVGPQSDPRPVLRPEVAGQAGSAGQHLRVEAGVGQMRRDELGGGELLAPELGVGVDVAAPRHQVVVVGVQPEFGGLDDAAHDARLACSSSTRSRSAGVSARPTTVRASMIAPSMTAASALGPAAAAANAGWCTERATGIDADDRVDAGHHLGDVAHVGAAQRQRRLDVGRRGIPAEPHHLGAERVGQPLVGRQLVVGGLGLGDLVVAAGGHRAGEEAVGHPLLQLAQRTGVVCPHRVVHFGASRNDVGGLAAVGDDAVHHLAGHQLLAQQSDGHLCNGDRVERR